MFLKTSAQVITLFLIIGFPRLSFVNIPIGVFILPFYLSTLVKTCKEIRTPLKTYGGLLLLFLVTGVINWLMGTGAITDLLFFVSILIKIILEVIFGIIVFSIIYKNTSALTIWLIIQLVLVALASVSYPIYSFLLNFMSPNSVQAFEGIYEQRSVGFGLYHVDGAVILTLVSAYLLIYKTKSVLLQALIFMVNLPIAMMVARSAIVTTALLGLLRYRIFTVLMFATMILIYKYNLLSGGAVDQALEPFINIYENATLETKSTDANLNMFILPDTLKGYAFGYGRFFDGPFFYKGTDLGWFRFLLFGGVPLAFFYLITNLYWPIIALKSKKIKGNKLFALLLIGLFIVLNFKGIQSITLFGLFPYLFYLKEENGISFL